MIKRTRPLNQFPDANKIDDLTTRLFGEELADVLMKALRNIHDDLVSFDDVLNIDHENNRIGIGVAVPLASVHIKAGIAAAGGAPFKLETGTNLSVPEAGTFEYDGVRFYLTEVVDRRVISLASDAITTPVTVADTTDETTVFTASISASELKPGKVYRVFGSGLFSTQNANDKFALKIKIGSTVLTSLQSKAGQVNNKCFVFLNVLTIRTIGVSGTLASHGHVLLDETEVHENDQDVAINTTIAENITITFQWDSADTDNTVTLDQCFLEVLN